MSDLILTERSNITTVADAIRNKIGSIEEMTFNQMAAEIENISSGGGTELPELTNPASEDEVFEGKEYIDSEGNAKTGNFTIDSELNEQVNVIAQISSLVDSKVSVSLPTLENPGGAENLQEGYQLIDDNGNIVNGMLSLPSWNQLNLLPDGGDSGSVGFIGLLPIPEISYSILIICDSHNCQLESIYVYPDIEYSYSLSVGMDMFNLSVQDFNNTKHLLISTNVDIQDYMFYMLLTDSFILPEPSFEESN